MEIITAITRPRNNIFPLFAWLIMIFQGMNPFKKESFSHMVIIIIKNYESIVLHSTFVNGVHINTLEDFLKKNKIIETKLLSVPENKNNLISWVYSVIGLDYDSFQIVGLWAKAIGLITFNKYGSNFRRMICSELILNYLTVFNSIDIKDSDSYSLVDVWKIIPEEEK